MGKIKKQTLSLSIEAFSDEISKELPCVYGNALVDKLEMELSFFKSLAPSLNCGDAHIQNEVFLEVKTSIIALNSKRKSFRIANIRFFQNKLEFIILYFIDRPAKKIRFYVVSKTDLENEGTEKGSLTFTPMSNTKLMNEGNRNIGYSTNVHKDNTEWIFSKINRLNGTSYSDLLKWLCNLNQNVSNRNEKFSLKITKGKMYKSNLFEK